MGLEHDMKVLERYYRLRAPEYEALYERRDPARQGELTRAGTALGNWVAGRRVLEVACGTGYWTRVASCVAREIVATDASGEMLAIARHKRYPRGNVRFARLDAYRLDEVQGDFDAALVNFWLSHVPKAKLEGFVDGLHARLAPDAHVFMIDNFPTPGYGGEFLREPGREDTFKLRELSDGSKHKIIKNYYEVSDLERLFRARSRDLTIEAAEFYWWLRYTVKSR